MNAKPGQRTALITGAAGGIGRAALLHFAGQGWNVIGVDRAEFAGEFPQPGLFIKLDIADDKSMETLSAQVNGYTDVLHALVNNAAAQYAKPLLDTSAKDWDALMAVNLRAPFLLVKRVYPLLKAASGAVVNLSSVNALATSADIAAYAASKGALLSLTRAMAVEFAPDKVRVNAVLPGAVDTDMLRAGLGRQHVQGGTVDERLDDLARKTVLGRVGIPEEVAHAIYFLADNDQSSFMTGQSIVVDGGATARLSTE